MPSEGDGIIQLKLHFYNHNLKPQSSINGLISNAALKLTFRNWSNSNCRDFTLKIHPAHPSRHRQLLVFLHGQLVPTNMASKSGDRWRSLSVGGS
ncbi:hypothetical protein AVEN_221326-1 [Araneus ventricosus]|uniref:Uncharacterized protein n=1 Tax=Araneus ventricosus TaxID=182803 RepID=A0A4Y2AZU2_ARAVE|nr:hypothetical protein AVEN_221326-1 [Araneus ventricosus]